MQVPCLKRSLFIDFGGVIKLIQTRGACLSTVGEGRRAGLCREPPAQPGAPCIAGSPLHSHGSGGPPPPPPPGQISTQQSGDAHTFRGLQASRPPNSVPLSAPSSAQSCYDHKNLGNQKRPAWSSTLPVLSRTQLPAHSSAANYRPGSARGVPEEGPGNLGLFATYGACQSPSLHASPRG